MTQKDKQKLKTGPLVFLAAIKNKFLATLSYLGIFCLVPILRKEQDEFVKFHAKQGLALFLFEILPFSWVSLGFFWFLYLFSPHLVYGLVSVVIPLIFFFLYPLLVIIGIVRAVTGHKKSLPVVGKFAEKFDYDFPTSLNEFPINGVAKQVKWYGGIGQLMILFSLVLGYGLTLIQRLFYSVNILFILVVALLFLVGNVLLIIAIKKFFEVIAQQNIFAKFLTVKFHQVVDS